MANSKKVIVAIDPDVKQSGVAQIQDGVINVFRMSLIGMVEYLQTLKLSYSNLTVVVEAGWKNKATWHLFQANNAKAAFIGRAVGANHTIGKQIVEVCKHFGINVVEQKPLRKRWSGSNGKITHEELAEVLKTYKLQGLPKRTNQDERDAALLALNQCLKEN